MINTIIKTRIDVMTLYRNMAENVKEYFTFIGTKNGRHFITTFGSMYFPSSAISGN